MCNILQYAAVTSFCRGSDACGAWLATGGTECASPCGTDQKNFYVKGHISCNVKKDIIIWKSRKNKKILKS